jgi:hypothetical protein
MRRNGWWLMVMGCLWMGLAQADAPAAGVVRRAPLENAGDKQGQPDESLLEFLGKDDVGDPGWWEFFRHHGSHARDPARKPAPVEGEQS